MQRTPPPAMRPTAGAAARTSAMRRVAGPAAGTDEGQVERDHRLRARLGGHRGDGAGREPARDGAGLGRGARHRAVRVEAEHHVFGAGRGTDCPECVERGQCFQADDDARYAEFQHPCGVVHVGNAGIEPDGHAQGGEFGNDRVVRRCVADGVDVGDVERGEAQRGHIRAGEGHRVAGGNRLAGPVRNGPIAFAMTAAGVHRAAAQQIDHAH